MGCRLISVFVSCCSRFDLVIFVKSKPSVHIQSWRLQLHYQRILRGSCPLCRWISCRSSTWILWPRWLPLQNPSHRNGLQASRGGTSNIMSSSAHHTCDRELSFLSLLDFRAPLPFLTASIMLSSTCLSPCHYSRWKRTQQGEDEDGSSALNIFNVSFFLLSLLTYMIHYRDARPNSSPLGCRFLKSFLVTWHSIDLSFGKATAHQLLPQYLVKAQLCATR